MRALAILGAALLLAGCASHEMVVVLPGEDGHVGGVVMRPTKGDTVVLDQAYASARPGDDKAIAADAEQVKKDFAEVLEARPEPPTTFQLFFIYGKKDLTPASEAKFPDVFANIARRKAAEIVITGHTDPVGNDSDNDALSLDRANIIKTRFQELEKAHQPPSDLTIRTVGRGERDAQVPDSVNCRDSTEAVCEAARSVDITVQ